MYINVENLYVIIIILYNNTLFINGERNNEKKLKYICL